MKRYSRAFSGGLVRDLERTYDAMYIDEQLQPHRFPRAHDTCNGMAAVKWGPMKLGEIIFTYTAAADSFGAVGLVTEQHLVCKMF